MNDVRRFDNRQYGIDSEYLVAPSLRNYAHTDQARYLKKPAPTLPMVVYRGSLGTRRFSCVVRSQNIKLPILILYQISSKLVQPI